MDKQSVETLAKVILAAAWADRTVSREEVESAKDLIFEFQHVLVAPDEATGSGLDVRESALLEMYTESPIEEAERERLVSELREAVWSEEDKALVLSALRRMVEADGQITDEEQAVLNEIETGIGSVDTGILGDLGRLMRGAMQRRSDALRNVPNRDAYMEDFLKNKVYYAIRRRLDLGEADLGIPDEELRKLATAGGMMARVAKVDDVVIEKETEKITSILQTNWGLSREAAALVIEVAMSQADEDFDYLRASREFLELTAPAERASLLDVLFTVANADGEVTAEETKEIHDIADYLLLSDNRVEEARLKITGG